MGPRCPGRWNRSCGWLGCWTDQSEIVPSHDPIASDCPSGENAIASQGLSESLLSG